MSYWTRRKARKHLKAAIHHARGLRHLREDVLAPAEVAGLDAATAAAAAARRGADEAAMRAALDALGERIGAATPPCRLPSWRENFEVLVVALGVAMAFRAYFYQPFKIPTGSMQPTLYGISSVDRPRPALLDRLPLKAAQWLFTGTWHREVRVRENGLLRLVPVEVKPGYATLAVGARRYLVPNDVLQRQGLWCRPDEQRGRQLPDRSVILGRVILGDVLWAGTVTTGDFVFVNRWKWNFRRPQRGEVMVFATTGIAGLPPDTHYIKRMCGLPDETLAIDPPNLLVDGTVATSPASIVREERMARLAPWAPPYAGYQVIGDQPAESRAPLRRPCDSIALGPDEYFAMGYNTGNSRDSRYWGPVPARNLLGPATVVYWPFASRRWGRID